MAIARDPVCGMEVDDRTSVYRSNYQGLTYFFCSEECLERFEQNPDQYAARR